MSYSMLSTKRKFHRLLDSLSNGSTPAAGAPGTDTSTPAALDGTSTESRPAKRPRPAVKQQHSQVVSSSPHLSLLLSRQAASRRASAKSQSSLQPGIMNISGTTQKAVLGEVGRLPPMTWNPKDKAAFLERVETFQSPGDWTYKREEICAVAFAKWGWKLVDVETVGCVSCHKRFVVYVRHYPSKSTTVEPEAENEHGEDADGGNVEEKEKGENKHSDLFVEKTVARLENEHDESCLWRKIHCDDSIWSLTMWPASKSVEALRQRYHAILGYSEVLPPVVTLPKDLENGEYSVAALTDLLDNMPSNRPVSQNGLRAQSQPETATTSHPPHIRQRAFAIALLGWNLVPELANNGPKDALFHCDQCLARVGIWLFWPKAEGKEPTYDEFDIVHHSMACPWSDAGSQNGGMKLDEGVTPKAAWEILRGMVISQSVSVQRQCETGSRAPMDDQEPQTPTRTRGTQMLRTPQTHSSSGTPKLTDEERKKKHKLGMAWLSKLKLGNKNDK